MCNKAELEKEVNELRRSSEQQAKHIVTLETTRSDDLVEKEKALTEARSRVNVSLMSNSRHTLLHSIRCLDFR